MKEQEHRKYYSNGIEIPSCTTIVGLLNKPELVGWANHMGFRRVNTTAFLKERADLGTHCHKLFETYFRDGLMCANGSDEYLNEDEYRMMIYRFRVIEKFFESSGIEVLNTELSMEGSTYGGTLDMIAYDRQKDCLMILDAKTSKNAYNTHWIQIMGYVQLVEEIYHLPIEEIAVILLSKPLYSDELVNIRQTKDCWRELEIFNKLRDIYYFLNGSDEAISTVLNKGGGSLERP